MAALIGLDDGPVTNIASRCSHFGVHSRVEIGGNVLAALPDGRRFEDAAATGVSNKVSEKQKSNSGASLHPNFDRLFASLAPPAQTLRKQMERFIFPTFKFI